MKTANFESTALKSATYDEKTRQLSVTFHSGGTAIYTDVPEEIFNGLKSAKSPGGYFHSSIRNAFARL